MQRPPSRSIVFVCAALLVPYARGAPAQSTTPAQQPTPQTQQQPAAKTEPAAKKLTADELDSLVAPIALYPDPLLGQTLVASTYPLEIVQLQQWLAKNPKLKDKALTDAVMKQPWDPSIQAMAVLPDVVKRLADDIQWTTDLGNAFLAQQGDVMDAVQRMRKKAEGTGALKSNEQQKVETKVVENKTVIVVDPANPEVVYVPAYSPTVVYGPAIYPYPPIYYPPYYPYSAGAVVATGMISFGVGMAVGAAWGGGGWGYGCGWGGNNINVNVNNNYVRNNNINRNTNVNRGGNWQHDASHRGGAPYGDRGTADRFGGTARGDSLSSRQSGSQSLGSGDRGAAGRDQSSLGSRSGSSGADSLGSRSGSGTRSASADKVGNREVSRSGASRSSSAFGGSSASGSSARSSSGRGASSMGSRGGGGGRRR